LGPTPEELLRQIGPSLGGSDVSQVAADLLRINKGQA